MAIRYIGMFVLTALAGMLSGFLWMVPNGLMAGALGMSLAGGAIWLGRRQQRQDGTLTRTQVLVTGMVCGLVAGVSMALISRACDSIRPMGEAAMFGPPVLPFWAPLVMGVLYGVVVHLGYAARLSSARPLRAAVVSTCLGCFLLKILATIFYSFMVQADPDAGSILVGSGMLALLGAVPFALLWVLGLAWLDPAWSARPALRTAASNGTETNSNEGAGVRLP
jgi:hypothetical protein